MIDVKQAVKAAGAYLDELYDRSTITDALLEEVELSEDEREWHVTLSFQRVKGQDRSFVDELLPTFRQFKTFTINAETGAVTAMRIRQLQ